MSIVIFQGIDRGAVGYYTDPISEQRALAAGSALTYVGHKEIVAVRGPDRLSWLTSLSSQKITELLPGQSAELLFLTLQGRIEHWAHAVDDGECAWLITEPGCGGNLAQFLDSMRFALRVQVEEVSSRYAIFGAVGDVADLQVFTTESGPLPVTVLRFRDLLLEARQQLRVWKDPWSNVVEGGFSYAAVEPERHPGSSYSWYEYIVPRQSLVSGPNQDILSSCEEVGALAGADAAEALRIAAWRPRFKADTDHRTIPHELDLMRTAVHLSKGCYKGQETVARVHNLGHPPRRLVFLHLDGSSGGLPAAGALVTLDGKELGRITSRALHYEMGPIALAVVKRAADPDRELIVKEACGEGESSSSEEYAAAQEPIVAVDAGAVVGKVKGNFLRRPTQRNR